MDQVDINQIQFKDLAKTISQTTGSVGASLSEKDNDFLLQKTTEFLGLSKRIIITNRKQSSDGYFLLDISLKGYRLLSSKSVNRSEYTYLFEENVFKLNGRVIDQSFLSQFMTYFEHITNQIEHGTFEIIEED